MTTLTLTPKPLLVVVEASPGLGLDGRAVRERIGAELRAPVVAPRDSVTGDASAVMTVALDSSEIHVWLHDGVLPPVSRVIPMPAERADRLQAIAWLAGNVARDQVSSITRRADATPLRPPLGESEPPVTAPARPTEPPPLPPADLSGDGVPETLTAKREDPPTVRGQLGWSVSVAAGPTITNVFDPRVSGQAGDSTTIFGSTYEVELQRVTSGPFLLGAAIDVGPNRFDYPRPHLFGAAAFLGSGWYRRRWFMEATAGVGVEAMRTIVTDLVHVEGSAGTEDKTVKSTQVQPTLYGRVAWSLGVPIAPSVDVMARLGAHVTSVGTPLISIENRVTDYVSATVGVRVRLP
jgi:hypothetical protein